MAKTPEHAKLTYEEQLAAYNAEEGNSDHCMESLTEAAADKAYQTCVDDERASTEALVALFTRILPEVFVCVECGPFMKSDEDGCCADCGSDGAIIAPFDAALTTYRERHNGG